MREFIDSREGFDSDDEERYNAEREAALDAMFADGDKEDLLIWEMA